MHSAIVKITQYTFLETFKKSIGNLLLISAAYKFHCNNRVINIDKHVKFITDKDSRYSLKNKNIS